MNTTKLFDGVELLQNLIRFDTTNPPGNELACVLFIQELLEREGFTTELVGEFPERPSLVTRLAGKNKAAPLLLYGHVDVVTTENQVWTHPPFSGLIEDGFIWGRGALDMKGAVAMMITALINLKRTGFVPAGDLVLVVLADEEAGGLHGAKYIVENHPEILKGIQYAIGEFGGFPIYLGGKKFYAIQIAEKQVCWMKGKITGAGGHASFPMQGGAFAKLGRILTQLDAHRLPYHLLPVVKKMFEIMAAHVEAPFDGLLSDLTLPEKVEEALAKMGPFGRLFDAILHNTVNTTVIRAGSKSNVIPSEVYLEFDGRLLPGFDFEDIKREILAITGNDLDLDILHYSPNLHQPDLSMFEFFGEVLKEMDPDGIPIPLLLSASTDARHFAQIGIQTYGFIPMNLPEGFDMMKYIHAADERIPVDAFRFGESAIELALRRYSGALHFD